MRNFRMFREIFLLFIILCIAGCGENQSVENQSVGEVTIKEITTPSGIQMIVIPAGEFVMGSDHGEDDEKPAHKVILTSFHIDQYEVTQKEYERLMGKNPSKIKNPNHPVEQVRWYDAIQYCNQRSMRDGYDPCYNLETAQCLFDVNGYRLPTEAEWEYACRAGTHTLYSYGNDPNQLAQYAWYKNNANKKTNPVGKKKPNPWGLYDMYGNVWEWCNDYYHETYASNDVENPSGPDEGEECVLRGGAWNCSEESCRSSSRFSETPGFADACFGADTYGFRCVRRPAADEQ